MKMEESPKWVICVTEWQLWSKHEGISGHEGLTGEISPRYLFTGAENKLPGKNMAKRKRKWKYGKLSSYTLSHHWKD